MTGMPSYARLSCRSVQENAPGPHSSDGVSLADSATASEACTQFVFIDPAVQDHGTLLRGLEPGAAACVLDPGRDGVRQIAEALAHRTGVTAVSVIAHGTAGSIALGSARLDEAGLPQHAAELRAIGRALEPGGALQLFACEAGQGPSGRGLVEALARAAGADVAASSRVLGGGEGGGDWTLDVRSSPGGTVPSLPIAAEALRSYGHALSGAGSPPAGFPLDITDFSAANASGGSFVTSGNATISGTALRLTPDTNDQAGSAVYSQSFSSSLGLSVQFTYDSSGGSGADGISFFLLNGDTVSSASSVTPGGYGGGLGYSDDGRAGITGGFLGIGLDTFGNYAQTDHGQASSGLSGTSNYIGVRGEGSGTSGYDWITGVPYLPGIDGQRTVQINLTPLSATQEQLQVYMEPHGSNTFTEVLNTTITQTLPNSFYFGFAASTGGSTDLHEIDNVSVKLPVNLTLGAATVTDTTTSTTNPATLNPGDQFSYTYTLTNSGPNDDGQITVNDALPANIVGASWIVTDSAGTHTGTGGAIPVNLLSGASATITVSGNVDPNATSGNADHSITVSPGAAYSLADPNEAAPVSLNIGQGGSSVSLVGANQGAATSDTAAITPFASAQVVDTFIDSSTGAPTDTLSVAIAPSAGALSATGGTYDASTGILTASGTASQLQAVLQSVTFTPAAHNAAPGSSATVPITVTVTDTDSNNTTGGGSPSATQTANVTVTAAHDTPVISGASSNQTVGDNATDAPFSTLSVTDPDDVGATASVTIAGGAAKGSFTAASSSGWTMTTAQNGDTTYTKGFTAQQDIGAAVQAAVQALVFQPTPLTAATDPSTSVGFSVTVTDTATPSASATDANTSVTVNDTTPPGAPAGLTLAPASDSGVKGDDITNVKTPTLTGTAEAGSTVTLDDGSTQLGTAVAGSNGTWSIVSSTLADGTYNLTATATDGAGNVSASSQPLALTIDTAAPAVTAALLHDTGASAADGITSDDTLSGTGSAGSVVTLTEGGHSVGTATVDGTGHWTVKPAGLADGAQTVALSDMDAAGNVGTGQVSFTLDTALPAAPLLALAPASDSGVKGDDLTNVVTPTITGTAAAGSTVTLDDGTTQLGTAVAAANGAWSITTGTLADGLHHLTATATDAAGNVSASSALALTIDTAVPTVTAAAEANPADPTTNAELLAGSADPNATIAISEGAKVVGTAQAGANGQWTFDPSNLTPGPQSLTASETNAAGNTGTAAAVTITVPDPRFDIANLTAATSGSFYGSDYTGPVSYLHAEYGYAGSDNVVLGAKVANVFMQSGAGEDALQVKAGSNVLDGGTGSNWLVGASGADGGTDTFFVDGRGGQNTWDTLLNFHPGDILTLWGYNVASGSTSWSDDMGAAGYHGATLHAKFGGGSASSALVTFEGLTTSGAHLVTSTGTSGGVSYLAVTRTA